MFRESLTPVTFLQALSPFQRSLYRIIYCLHKGTNSSFPYNNAVKNFMLCKQGPDAFQNSGGFTSWSQWSKTEV